MKSDCFTSGPDALVVHLTNLLRSFIVHGMVPLFVLTCTLLPLVKDNLADITTSDKYRAIASGSILLKLLDIVIMILKGNKLQCDQLQFGFQEGSSTTMCTWTATTVIEHYNQRGSDFCIQLSLDTILEGGELLLTQYLNAGGAIDPTVQVGEVASVVDGRPRELGDIQIDFVYF